MKPANILFGFLFLLALCGAASAYTDNTTAFFCGNSTMTAAEICTDCTNALNNNSRTVVVLNVSVSGVSGTCINNPANFSNKTFDCQGYTIDGDDTEEDYGIYLNNKQNNTIRNCVITDFRDGIYLNSSTNNNLNNNLNNNTINSNTLLGIYLWSSSNNTLANNIVNSDGNYGIYLSSSSNNTLANNTANNNRLIAK